MQSPEPSSLQDRIRRELEQSIHDGCLKPGMAIDDKALALHFDTSRTPVREALLLLQAKGLVDIVPRAGIYVHKPTATELVAMMEALGELEGVLARLATLRIGAALRDELRQALQGTQERSEAQDPAGYAQANALLHDVIYRASVNPFIVEEAKTVRLRISPFRRRIFEKPGRLAQSQSEHRRVVDAILAGDPDGAAEAMRGHISAGGQVFADLILGNELS